MVTLLDMTDDHERLMDAFSLLRQESQDDILVRVSVAACYSVMLRSDATLSRFKEKSPEQVTEKFLLRCMPSIPGCFHGNDELQWEYDTRAQSAMERQALPVVLAPSRLDAKNAAHLLWLLNFCAEETCRGELDECEHWGGLNESFTLRFIEKWRDSFTSNLARAAASLNR